MLLIDDIYYSNTYPVFLKLKESKFSLMNDQVNILAALAYKCGTKIYENDLKYGMKEEITRYQKSLFLFISSEKYKLLLRVIPLPAFNDTDDQIDLTNNSFLIGCSKQVENIHVKRMDKYWIINDYEAFLNYGRYRNLPINRSINDVFFHDFIDSLFATDFSMYNTDENLGFLTVTDINRPNYCFNFICYYDILIIAQYVRKNRNIKAITAKQKSISINSISSHYNFNTFFLILADDDEYISPCELCECEGQACDCCGCIIEDGYNICTNCD
ncbi:MAG: hypothetical protein GYA02_03775 [Clostridiaceae bacterium]|jgi:hypothetical protein|nr:hypothetical protein [Clostridiaceae bacterium]